MKLSRRHFAGFLVGTILQTQLGSRAMANEGELKFTTHDLNIQAYSISDVNLVYAGSPHELSAGQLTRAKTVEDETRYPGGKSGSYQAFAGPVQIDWRSKDGTQIKYALDLDAVFKDRKILHTEDVSKLYKPEPVYGGEPTIIIELNDRTLNVYMFVTMRLEHDETKRIHHDHRTLAFSKTF